MLARRPNPLRSVLDRAFAEPNLLSQPAGCSASGASATVVPRGDFSALRVSVITRLMRDQAPVCMEPIAA